MSTGVLSVSDVYTRVKRTFGDESGAQVTEDDITRWINDAQREAVMQNEGLLETVGYLDTVAGTLEYTVPTDLFVLGHLYIKDGGVQAYYSLKWLPLKEFSEQVDGWDGNSVRNYPCIYTQQQDNKLIVFPAPQTDTDSGLKLVYSRYATDVVDSGGVLDVPPYLHSYIVNFCLMQAYEMDEDWESAGQKAAQIQGDLDFNNNRKFWFGHDSYPTMSTDYEDLN